MPLLCNVGLHYTPDGQEVKKRMANLQWLSVKATGTMAIVAVTSLVLALAGGVDSAMELAKWAILGAVALKGFSAFSRF
jgi:hypothetical protein